MKLKVQEEVVDEAGQPTTQEVIVDVDNEGFQIDAEGNRVNDNEGNPIQPEGEEYTPPPEEVEILVQGKKVKIPVSQIIDDKGVPYFNRSKELDRVRAENEENKTRLSNAEKRTEGTEADIRKQLVDSKKTQLRSRYPNLDDDVIEAMAEEHIQTKIETTQNLQYAYQTDKANDRVEVEKGSLGELPYYQRFKDEIDALINSQPLQVKMTKGMVKRCYDMVVGQHTQELIDENKGRKVPDEHEIAGQIGAPKGSTSTIGKSKLGTLNKPQATQSQQMGLRPDSYLSILAKHKIQAKKDGLPEPELLTDKWRK